MKSFTIVVVALFMAPLAFGQADRERHLVGLDNLVTSNWTLSDGRLYVLNIQVDRTENKDFIFGGGFDIDPCIKPGVCAILTEDLVSADFSTFTTSNRELARREYAIGANINTARLKTNSLVGPIDVRWTGNGISTNEFVNRSFNQDGTEVRHLYSAFDQQTANVAVKSPSALDGATLNGAFLSKLTTRHLIIILP